MVSVDVKHHVYLLAYIACSELRSCVKVEVVVLGSPSLIIRLVVSVDVKQYCVCTEKNVSCEINPHCRTPETCRGLLFA